MLKPFQTAYPVIETTFFYNWGQNRNGKFNSCLFDPDTIPYFVRPYGAPSKNKTGYSLDIVSTSDALVGYSF